MMNTIIRLIFIFISVTLSSAQDQFEVDTIETASGKLLITFIGHGTLMFNYNQKVIHIDPVNRYADYSLLPKADIILVTHHHGDHLNPDAINLIKKESTDLVCTAACYEKTGTGTVLKNGDSKTVQGIKIEAVPAYNLLHKRDNGEFFHPKGIGNGYVITMGEKRVYIAGDTENVPEMKNLQGVDIAFLPMNLPYTMTLKMVVDAVNMLQPKIFYPYHFGNTNIDDLLALLKDKKDCDIRVRKMN
jgi:L-ascorbate metabolism protein UlaG (beta-lactamase superfamily)